MKSRRNTNKSIFVSSTFRDMQAERDVLRDYVLPKVNSFAAQYGRAVELIDLRWGVDTANTTEEEQNHKVLRTCLDEIERSRPFFIGLIGDRYGWTPPQTDMQAALDACQFPLDDLNMSVTALEIVYGVLRSETPPVSLFYYRQSPDYEKLPAEMSRIYRDGAEGLAKLEKLKEEISNRFGSDVKDYAVEIDENGLNVSAEWSDMVADDIITKLRLEWGDLPDTPPDWKEHERDIQDAFRESRTAHFAGRTAAISEMSAFCLGDETPQLLMMQGEPGSGKSGLMCKVMEEIEEKCLLLPFCCGISPRSALSDDMMRYFIAILCEELGQEDDSDTYTKFQDIKDRFFELLFIACKKTRVVAVVDALDQLAQSDEAMRMLWISGKLPDNFRLLCSIIDGQETEAIKRLGGEVRPIPSISKEDEAAIIHGIAERHHKQISNAVVDYILQKQTPDGKQAAQNPLYLSLITQDLVMMDRYELDIVQKYMESGMNQPDALAKFMRERIDKIPGEPEGAYLFVLQRLDKLIGGGLVLSVTGLIAASNSGIRETDIDGFFRSINEYSESETNLQYNPADFSWLRQMMRGQFIQGDVQQWQFSHRSLWRAIWHYYEDLPVNLSDGLSLYYCEIAGKDRFAAENVLYSAAIGGRPDIAAVAMTAFYDEYKDVFAQGLAEASVAWEEGDEDEEGEEYENFVLDIAKAAKELDEDIVAKEDYWKIARIMYDCTFLPLMIDDVEFNTLLMFQAEELLEGLEDSKSLSTLSLCKINIAQLLMDTGESESAEDYFVEGLELQESVYKQTGEIDDLFNLARAQSKKGDYYALCGDLEEAEQLYFNSMLSYQNVFELDPSSDTFENLMYLYYNIGALLEQMGNDEKAGEFFEMALEGWEAQYNRVGSKEALKGFIHALLTMGKGSTNEDCGETYYKKALTLSEQLFSQYGMREASDSLRETYGCMGSCLRMTERMEEAGEYFEKQLELAEETYERRQTLEAQYKVWEALQNMVEVLKETEEIADKVVDYLEKANTIAYEMYEQEDQTIGAIRCLRETGWLAAEVFSSYGLYSDAEEIYEDAIEAAETAYENSDAQSDLKTLMYIYNDMGDCLTALGKKKKAKEYYKKAEQIKSSMEG